MASIYFKKFMIVMFMTLSFYSWADDSEVYLNNTDSPVIMFLIDTSGSMLFPANNEAALVSCIDSKNQKWDGSSAMSGKKCAKYLEDRRIGQVRLALRKVILSLPDNYKVGISRYNSDSRGGRIIYPAYKLTDKGIYNNAVSVRQDILDLLDKMADFKNFDNQKEPPYKNENLLHYMGGGTPLNESYYETARYLLGDTLYYGINGEQNSIASSYSGDHYISPFSCGASQNSAASLIVLTDGEPSNDSDAVAYDSCSSQDSWQCMAKTARYLASGIARNSVIKTSTIGFGPDISNDESAAVKGLKNVAEAGGGKFYKASSVDELVEALENNLSLMNVTSSQASATSSTRQKVANDIFFSLFMPSRQQRWLGNIKHYALSNTTVVDSHYLPAIDASTDSFLKTAQSFWSAQVDGNDVFKGGALEQRKTAHNVFIDKGKPGVLYPLNANEPGWSEEDYLFVKGVDKKGSVVSEMGASIHGKPVWVLYGKNDAALMVATNDGLIHHLNAEDGTENWVWSPSFIKNILPSLRVNNPLFKSQRPIYTLDGELTYYFINNHKMIYGGMRQGGNSIFALQLGDKKTDVPELKWFISPSSAGFEDLAYTWSKPIYTKIKINKVKRDIIIFSGGLDYDVYELGGPDKQPDKAVKKGASLYFVDAETGVLLWHMQKGNAAATTTVNYHPDLNFSITAEPRIVDKNNDGFADFVYVGDLGGQIFRVDINNDSKSNDFVNRVRKIASLGSIDNKSQDRRFYETPAVVFQYDTVNNKKIFYAAVAVGSGDRNWPESNKVTQDKFFVIKDYDAARIDIFSDDISESGLGKNASANLSDIITVSDLSNVSNSQVSDDDLIAAKGWYISMPNSGEKVLSSPLIVASQNINTQKQEYYVYFNSYIPAKNSNACSINIGKTNTWRVLLKSGNSAVNNDGLSQDTRFIEGVANGISGDPAIIVSSDEKNKKDNIICGFSVCHSNVSNKGVFNREDWFKIN